MLAITPDSTGAKKGFAYNAYWASENEKAANAFQQIAYEIPDDPEPRIGVGNARIAEGQARRSAQAFKQALAVDATNAEARSGLRRAFDYPALAELSVWGGDTSGGGDAGLRLIEIASWVTPKTRIWAKYDDGLSLDNPVLARTGQDATTYYIGAQQQFGENVIGVAEFGYRDLPIGYEVIDRKLIPVPVEAERVRTIMRRYIASRSANELIAQLEAEGIRTKVQLRTSGPHKGGIPFRRGSLFHLLKNPIYCGKIVHKGEVYDGQHEAIVDEELWNAVEERLKQKVPPRRRAKNDPHEAMLRGLLTDPEDRPMVPTYVTKGNRRYAYYETRKDIVAKEGAGTATRIGQRQLERHLIVQLSKLFEDERALRRITGAEEGSALRDLFARGEFIASRFAFDGSPKAVIPQLVTAIQIRHDQIDLQLNASALGCGNATHLNWSIALPARQPFRESKLRIDPCADTIPVDRDLLGKALKERELVLASPELSLNQIA